MQNIRVLSYFFDGDGFFGEKNSCRNHLCWTVVTHVADPCSIWLG